MPPENSSSGHSQGSLPFFQSDQPSCDALKACIDGGSRGNPGEAGAGVYFERGGSPWRGLYVYLGRQTNNYAEYSALILAIEYALKEGCRRLEVYADSELLVRQIVGSYRVRHPVLQQLHARAVELSRGLAHFSIHHIPRERNRKADALANKAQDLRASGEERYS